MSAVASCVYCGAHSREFEGVMRQPAKRSMASAARASRRATVGADRIAGIIRAQSATPASPAEKCNPTHDRGGSPGLILVFGTIEAGSSDSTDNLGHNSYR